MEKPLIYVVCGPTSTGKSDYAVNLAWKINGEIISADSRQIYREMDLGTGKINEEEMKGIPHHLLDIKNPDEDFSVEEFQKLAYEKIEEILSRDKTPIICGGTGFFIQSVVKNIIFPVVPKNEILRQELENKSLEELKNILESIPKEKDVNIDLENKRRVIRAIELGQSLGKIPSQKFGDQKYDFKIIGLDKPDEELKDRIAKRLDQRIDSGMIAEVQKLHDKGVSWERLESFGLEYRYISEFLQEKIDEEEMKNLIKIKSFQYAKRQRTWFRKDKRIEWI